MELHVDQRAKVELNDIKSKEGTPEFDYFLGILATDGYIYKRKSSSLSLLKTIRIYLFIGMSF